MSQKPKATRCTLGEQQTFTMQPSTPSEAPSSPKDPAAGLDGGVRTDSPQMSAQKREEIVGITGFISPRVRRLLVAWLLLDRQEETGEIRVQYPENTRIADLLLDAPDHVVAVGDLLEELELADTELVSLSGVPCRGKPLEEVQELLVLLEGLFSLVFRRCDGEEGIKRIVVLKQETADSPSAVSDLTASFEVYIPFQMNRVEEASMPASPDGKSHPQLTELCIGSLPDTGFAAWLRRASLSEGDRILEVNGKDCVIELSPSDAQTLVSTMYVCSPFCLTMLVNTPPRLRSLKRQSWRDYMRRGAVAVSGGTMIGVGAVLMATPLHPLGHAMAIGGVGVLGTEFEQPKRLAKRASSRFSNVADRLRQSFHKENEVSIQSGTDSSTSVMTVSEDTCKPEAT